jgi:hypothetical protein
VQVWARAILTHHMRCTFRLELVRGAPQCFRDDGWRWPTRSVTRRGALPISEALVAPDDTLEAHRSCHDLCSYKVSSDGSKRLQRSAAPRRVTSRIDEYVTLLYELLTQLVARDKLGAPSRLPPLVFAALACRTARAKSVLAVQLPRRALQAAPPPPRLGMLPPLDESGAW